MIVILIYSSDLKCYLMLHILKVHQKEIKNAASLVGFLLNEGNFETFSFWN
jgi:hypothetical protein